MSQYNPIVKRYEDDVLSGKVVAGELLKLAVKRQRDDLKNGHKRGLYFDHEAGQHILSFFELLNLAPDSPFELQPWQMFRLYVLYGWKREDGRRRFRYAYLSVARKNGKALALDTPIPTTTGWTTMGSIKEGDKLFDENGRPCNVTYVADIQRNKTCYEVVFSDGNTIIADAEHLWQTQSRINGRPNNHKKQPDDDIWTTQQIKDSLLVRNPFNIKHNRTEYNHSIPCCGPIQTEEKELPIDPYALGVWLGDGESSGHRLTCSKADVEIISMLRSKGLSVEIKCHKDRTERYAIQFLDQKGSIVRNGFRSALKRLNLLNNKHIPGAYLRSSIAQRTELLRGLMDTDGYASKAGQCEFTTILPQLRDGFMELTTSLGFKPTVKTARATMNGIDCGEKYRIQFWAYADNPAFHLKRKAERLKQPPLTTTRAARRKIVAINPVESVPVRCIAVDSPSHLFLAGKGMVPTHNTPISSGEILYHLYFSGVYRAEAYVSATKEEQAKIAFNDAKNIINCSPDLEGIFGSTATTIFCEETGSKFQFLTSNPKTADGTRPSFALIDEYHEFSSDDMLTKLRTGQVHHKEPLFSIVTTRGSHKDWPCYETERRVYIPILKGSVHNDNTFVLIFSQDKEEEFDQPETWAKSNPMLGTILELSKLIEERDTAMLKGEEAIVGFKTLNLNWWCDAPQTFIPEVIWNKSGKKFDPEILKGRQCWGGLDMGATNDFCAFSLYFPPENWQDFDQYQDEDAEKLQYIRTPSRISGQHYALWWFWIPEYKFENRIANGMHSLRDWRSQKLITLLDGNVVDPTEIEKDIRHIMNDYDVRSMAYDRYNATSTALSLQKHGLPVFEFPQTMPMFAEPTKAFRDLVLREQFNHGHNPIATWMMRNAVPITDTNGNIKITKDEKRSVDKVDGVIAQIMAQAAFMADRDTAGRLSQYETMDFSM